MYFMTRPWEQQFGITNHPEQRLSTHRRAGWVLRDLIGPFPGGQVLAMESTVKAWLRAEHLTVTGSTEVWSVRRLNVSNLSQLMDAIRASSSEVLRTRL